jgi:hypothetical protein
MKLNLLRLAKELSLVTLETTSWKARDFRNIALRNCLKFVIILKLSALFDIASNRF